MGLKAQASGIIPMPQGNFKMVAYSSLEDDTTPHFAIINEEFDIDEPVIVRIHSECITGDLFGSKRCDCGEQLDESLQTIGKHGGIVIYLRQEGRGIGIINKLKAYNLQDQGLDTVDANTHLGFEPDERTYEIAFEILKDLGVKKIRLLTNNPEKISAFEQSDIEIVERLPIEIKPGEQNRRYLETKKTVMGHMLKLK